MRDTGLSGRRFFLTPVCLVPNGRAHLGHVAGPLLKMDVLRRHLARAGADVRMVSMSDAHESHVLIRAYQEGSTPEEVANRFHAGIVGDLAALDIAYDDLLNPLDPAWAATYEAVNRGFLADIARCGNAAVRAEPLPILAEALDGGARGGAWRPGVGDPVVSGWLKGRCPHCGETLVGFFCESCGGHFSPGQMREPGTAHFPGTLRFEERRTLFLELRGGPRAILDHLERSGTRADFVDIARRYLDLNGASIRLSVPSPWGLALDDPAISPGQVIFSYSALLIGCHLVAGERYRQLTGSEVNPFAADSDVACILSFGIDNTVPFLVGAVGCALGQDRYRPVDHFLVNYFYDLDGAKFSTSRGHVIWGGDIVTLGGADVDLVRAYLCWRTPEHARASFGVDEFIGFHNALGARLGAATSAAARAARGAGGYDDGVMRHLEHELRAQSAALCPERFDVAAAAAAVDRWLRRAPEADAPADAALAWLAGFSLLAWPVLPRSAGQVWRWLGLPGEPSLDRVDEGRSRPRPADPHVPLARFQALTWARLNPSLPTALRRSA
jgi:methionyl-tRNA synthetase